MVLARSHATVFRVYGISPLNWLVLIIYVVNLFNLSLRFGSLYARFAIGATVLTNVLLLGLSDALAQSLRSAAVYKRQHESDTFPNGRAQSMLFNYVLDRGRQRQVWLDEEGDSLAELGLVSSHQNVEGTSEAEMEPWFDFDFRRLALFSFWGFLVSFVQSPWYGFLRTAYSHDAQLVVVVQRVLADQLVYSPIMLAIFVVYLSVVVESNSWTIVHDSSMWTKYVQTLGINMCVWPAAQFINFLIIPTAAQIPFSSSLSVLWNTYLSLNTN